MSKAEIIDGFSCYAPELAEINDGFSAESFKLLFELEKGNFWFRSRNELIQFFFKNFLDTKEAEVCEIGCGTGFVLEGLATLPGLRLSGSEIHLAGLKYAKLRLPDVNLFQADATRLPFHEMYDAIGAFDVLEHIEEDVKAMMSIHKSLKKEGLFFISVPQFQWMWSAEDDVAYHKRRYSRRELINKLEGAGFHIVYISSFVFTLFPFMVAQRFLGKLNKVKHELKDSTQGLKLPSFINRAFYMLMKIDLFLIRKGASLPWGGSLVVVAKKK